MEPEPEIIESPLSRTIESGGKNYEVQIYRLVDTSWTLEVVDPNGTSAVWDDEFETDTQAFEVLESETKDVGIEALFESDEIPDSNG